MSEIKLERILEEIEKDSNYQDPTNIFSSKSPNEKYFESEDEKQESISNTKRALKYLLHNMDNVSYINCLFDKTDKNIDYIKDALVYYNKSDESSIMLNYSGISSDFSQLNIMRNFSTDGNRMIMMIIDENLIHMIFKYGKVNSNNYVTIDNTVSDTHFFNNKFLIDERKRKIDNLINK